jgi:hypothetical protein
MDIVEYGIPIGVRPPPARKTTTLAALMRKAAER